MSRKVVKFEFDPGQVDETVARAAAPRVDEAANKIKELNATLPFVLFRPFKLGETRAIQQGITEEREAAREWVNRAESNIAENRKQAAYLRDFFRPWSNEPQGRPFSPTDRSLKHHFVESVRRTYEIPIDAPDQTPKLTVPLFDSTEPYAHPNFTTILKTLEELGFAKDMYSIGTRSDHPFRAQLTDNRQWSAETKDHVTTHATIFPQQWTEPHGYVDQDEHPLTVYYSEYNRSPGPDVRIWLEAVILQPAQARDQA